MYKNARDIGATSQSKIKLHAHGQEKIKSHLPFMQDVTFSIEKRHFWVMCILTTIQLKIAVGDFYRFWDFCQTVILRCQNILWRIHINNQLINVVILMIAMLLKNTPWLWKPVSQLSTFQREIHMYKTCHRNVWFKNSTINGYDSQRGEPFHPISNF